MRILLMTVSLLSSFHFALGSPEEGPVAAPPADTQNNIEDQASKIQTKIDNINRKIAEAKAQEDTINQQVENFQKKINDAHCSIGGICQLGATMSSSDVMAVSKKISDMRDSIDSIDKSVSSMNESIQTLNYQKTAAQNQSLTPAATDQRLRALKKSNDEMAKKLTINYEGAVINTNMTNLKWKAQDAQTQLDLIQKEMDNSKVGLYLQDKIGALLNSRLICETVNRHCLSPDKAPIDRSSLKEIFPDISDSNSRSGAENRARTFDKTSTSK